MRKRIISTLLCMLMIAGVITAAMPSASAASNPYPETQDVDKDGLYEIPCTRFAWQQVYDNFGIALPAWGNAWTWFNSAKNAGISTGYVAKPGSVAVWSGDTYGHVAYVTAASGNTFTVNEGGRTDLDHTNSHGVAYGYTLTNAVGGQRPYDTGKTLVGFIYPTETANWYDSLSPVNLGDDFYAAIIKNSSWINIGNVNGNVQLIDASKTPAGADMWHFKRQGDGSYVIFNCLDGNALDVTGAGTTNGTNIGTYPYWGHDAQKWYIYGRWSGEYIFRPKLCDKVLDVTGNNDTIGTNVELWTYNNSGAQQLAIWKVDGVGSSVLSVTPGSSNTETKFTWTAASNATHYSLRIRKGSPGNTEAYKDVWGTTETSYSIVLPAGYYEVYVDAANSFSYLASNTVSFTVKESVQGDANCDNKVNLLDGVLAQKVSLQMTTLSEQGIANADMNGDGKITILDAILIQKKALSL